MGLDFDDAGDTCSVWSCRGWKLLCDLYMVCFVLVVRLQGYDIIASHGEGEQVSGG